MAQKPVSQKPAPKPKARPRPARPVAKPAAKAAARPSRRPAPVEPAAPPIVKPPKATANELDLLKELSNAASVSGDEGAVRKIILDAIRPHVDEVNVDVMGNVLAIKRGPGRGERVLVAAHMDEVGFMVSGHDADGTLRIEIVGGVDDRVLLGKHVLVGAKRVPGVIGVAPVHLLNADRRSAVTKANQLRVDLGVESADAAKKLAKAGDRGVFATEFDVVGPSLRGKALDDRLGCATLVELLRGGPYSFDLHAAFTVQEEVGLRGAKVAGYAVDPVCAFVLDCTPAHDLPHSDEERENAQYNTRLGYGPAIYVADASTLHDARLVAYLQATAAGAGIPYQIQQPGGGGTDAGSIHRNRAGVPTVSLSVPGRYLHTPVSLVRAEDWRNSVKLMKLALEGWTTKILKR